MAGRIRGFKPKGIFPKVKIIAQLEFELGYYDSAVQWSNHYTRRTFPVHKFVFLDLISLSLSLSIAFLTSFSVSFSPSLSLSLYIYIYIYIVLFVKDRHSAVKSGKRKLWKPENRLIFCGKGKDRTHAEISYEKQQLISQNEKEYWYFKVKKSSISKKKRNFEADTGKIDLRRR